MQRCIREQDRVGVANLSPNVVGALTPAKYVLAQKGTGYHWNLLATNGRVIATSEHYNSKAAAMNGIRSVQKNGSTDGIVTDEEPSASRKPAK